MQLKIYILFGMICLSTFSASTMQSLHETDCHMKLSPTNNSLLSAAGIQAKKVSNEKSNPNLATANKKNGKQTSSNSLDSTMKPSPASPADSSSRQSLPPDSLDSSLVNLGLKRYLIFSGSFIVSFCLEIYALLSKKLTLYIKYASAALYGLSLLFVLLDYLYFRAIMSAYAMTIYFMLPVAFITFAIATYSYWFPFVSEYWVYLVTTPLCIVLLFAGHTEESKGVLITFQEFLKADYFIDQAVQKLVVYRDTCIVTVFLNPFYKVKKYKAIKKDGLDKKRNPALPSPAVKTEKSDSNSSTALTPSFYFTFGSLEHFERVLKETQELIYNQTLPMAYIPINYTNHGPGIDLGTLLYIIFLAVYFYSASDHGKGPLSILFKKFDWVNTDDVATRFSDVKGMEGAKAEVLELVTFLKSPEKFKNFGISIPRGVLLSGPPGCGKTLLAKAIAGEAGVPFLAISGSDFVEVYVGIGSKRVRDLFAKARKRAPCIIFIDELDAIGRDRSGQLASSEEQNTLNQLLVEMDGFNSAKTNVIIIGATNRPDILDPALKRPGRLDRHIAIPLPTMMDRQMLFHLYLRKIPKADDFSLSEATATMAKLTPGMSGADIKHICNEAGILAIRRALEVDNVEIAGTSHTAPESHPGSSKEASEASSESEQEFPLDTYDAMHSGKVALIMCDLQDALERVLLGHKNTSLKSRKEHLQHTAYHEAGHALIAWLEPHGQPPTTLTIVPRTSGTLGHNLFGMREEEGLFTKQQILADIKMLLGGHLAEALIYPGHLSTGASSDLENATKLAYTFVGLFEHDTIPFSEETLKSLSQQTRARVDDSVRDLMVNLREEVSQTLKSNRHLLITLAEKLLEVESMTAKDIENCIGPKAEAPPLAPALFE